MMPRFNGIPAQNPNPATPPGGRFGGIAQSDAVTQLPDAVVTAPSQDAVKAADREATISSAMGFDPLGIATRAGNMVRTYIDSKAAPDSMLRRWTDTVAENAIGAPVA